VCYLRLIQILLRQGILWLAERLQFQFNDSAAGAQYFPLNRITGFLEVIKQLLYSPLVPSFRFQYLTSHQWWFYCIEIHTDDSK
jgi:hypothetical protein